MRSLQLICYISTMNWTVETLNDTVDAELSALPNDMKARFVWIYNLIARLESGEQNITIKTLNRIPQD